MALGTFWGGEVEPENIFYFGVGGSEGLALSIVRLQSLSPLLIKLNKATLN